MNEKDVQKYLAAFADGELDVQDNLRVLEHIRMNPQATRRVMHQQQLRQAVARSMADQVPAVPSDLRAKLEALAGETPETVVSSDDSRDAAVQPPPPAPAPAPGVAKVQSASIDDEPEATGVLARIGQWLPSAVAAGLLIGAALFYWQAHNTIENPAQSDPRQPAVQTVVEMISPHVQNALTSRHMRCVAEVNRLKNATRFPADVNAVAPVVDSFLEGEGHTYSVLDLKAMGYDYVGAGECGSPGARAVHLIYKPTNQDAQVADPTAGLSLWVCADTGQFDHLAQDWLYKVEAQGTGKPIVVWRHEGMVYYITGDSVAGIEGAARTLVTRG